MWLKNEVLQRSLNQLQVQGLTKQPHQNKAWSDPFSKCTTTPWSQALHSKSTTTLCDWKQCVHEDKIILRSLPPITDAHSSFNSDSSTEAGSVTEAMAPHGNPQFRNSYTLLGPSCKGELVNFPHCVRNNLTRPVGHRCECSPEKDRSSRLCKTRQHLAVREEVGHSSPTEEGPVISRKIDHDASDLGYHDALVLLRRTSPNFGVHSMQKYHKHDIRQLDSSQTVATVEPASEVERSKILREQSNGATSESNLQRGAHPEFEPETVQNFACQYSRAELILKLVRDLLHAQNYSEIIQIIDKEEDLDTLPPSQRVQLHFILALAYYKMGKLQKAKEYFKQAERVPSIKKGDVAMCNIYLGDIYFASGLYHRAAECYNIAVLMYDADNLASVFRMIPPTLSAIHAKCGSCFRHVSKSVEAINEYKKAIEVAVTDKDRLTAHTSLGNLYQSLGQNAEALQHYESSIKLAENIQDFISLGWAHGNMGNAYLGLYRKDEALFHLQKSLDLTVEHEPTPMAIGRAYNNIGTAYQSLGDLDKAEEHYDLSLSQSIYGNDIPGQARVYGNIGNVLMIRKDYERAIPHYTEVLRLSKDSSTTSTARHNRGCAYYEWAESKMASLEGLNSLSPEFHAPRERVTDSALRVKGTVSTLRVKGPVSEKTENLPAVLVIPSLDKASTSIMPSFRYHVHDSSVDFRQNNRPRLVIESIAELYRQGMTDLREVVAQHEVKFENVKGSSKGLSLSVSLFESNSRTFHRLQDCLVGLGSWRDALLVAEQSRARTLGELMLSRKGRQLQNVLTTPLTLEHIFSIVSSQSSPILYLSYTGARLLGWILLPQENSQSISMEMFEVPLADDQFDGKSLDYHLRYSLTEALVERSYEMYQAVTYDQESSAPVQNLYSLIAKPLLEVLKALDYVGTSKKLVLVTDTYTSFVPFTCLLDPEGRAFLGDHFELQLMPSLLTMGVMDQLPEAIVSLPADPRSMCVVGNPTIPSFYYNESQWNLGKLPHAKREALWVGHILKTTPILEEQATKNAVMMRIMSAQVIHIATHGSASAGFLAFASSSTTSRPGVVVSSVQVLLHPEEVEKLSISPALVVLSSCDSGRGVVKADGIQGMARAFILAGMTLLLCNWLISCSQPS